MISCAGGSSFLQFCCCCSPRRFPCLGGRVIRCWRRNESCPPESQPRVSVLMELPRCWKEPCALLGACGLPRTEWLQPCPRGPRRRLDMGAHSVPFTGPSFTWWTASCLGDLRPGGPWQGTLSYALRALIHPMPSLCLPHLHSGMGPRHPNIPAWGSPR